MRLEPSWCYTSDKVGNLVHTKSDKAHIGCQRYVASGTKLGRLDMGLSATTGKDTK